MRKLKVVLVDDDPMILDLHEIYLRETEKVEVLAKVSQSVLVESTLLKHRPDVVFMDIDMPKLNGLEVLENIRRYNQDLKVVFITAHHDFGIKALKLQAFDYLTKPTVKEELFDVVLRIWEYQNNLALPKKKIQLPVKGGVIFLKLEEIFYLTALGTYTEIHLLSGAKHISSYNLGKIAEELPIAHFKRVSRNCIIHDEYLYYVDKKNKCCTLKAGDIEQQIEVSSVFLRNMHASL